MGMGGFVDLFLWRWLLRNDDLFLLNCASMRRVFLKRVCSSLFMVGGGLLYDDFVWFE